MFGLLFAQAQTTELEPKSAVTVLALSFIPLVLLYLIPTWIAIVRKPHTLPAVIAINIFFGWTFFGWFLALALAFRPIDVGPPPSTTGPNLFIGSQLPHPTPPASGSARSKRLLGVIGVIGVAMAVAFIGIGVIAVSSDSGQDHWLEGTWEHTDPAAGTVSARFSTSETGAAGSVTFSGPTVNCSGTFGSSDLDPGADTLSVAVEFTEGCSSFAATFTKVSSTKVVLSDDNSPDSGVELTKAS